MDVRMAFLSAIACVCLLQISFLLIRSNDREARLGLFVQHLLPLLVLIHLTVGFMRPSGWANQMLSKARDAHFRSEARTQSPDQQSSMSAQTRERCRVIRRTFHFDRRDVSIICRDSGPFSLNGRYLESTDTILLYHTSRRTWAEIFTTTLHELYHHRRDHGADLLTDRIRCDGRDRGVCRHYEQSAWLEEASARIYARRRIEQYRTVIKTLSQTADPDTRKSIATDSTGD